MIREGRRSASFFFFIFLIFFLERTIKHYMWHRQAQGFFIFPEIYIEPLLNSGAVFGVPVPAAVIYTVTAAVMLTLIIFLSRWWLADHWSAVYFSGLVLVGGLSNVLDRLYYGAVLDYIHLWWLPVFNLADLYILAGTAGLILSLTSAYGGHSSVGSGDRAGGSIDRG